MRVELPLEREPEDCDELLARDPPLERVSPLRVTVPPLLRVTLPPLRLTLPLLRVTLEPLLRVIVLPEL